MPVAAVQIIRFALFISNTVLMNGLVYNAMQQQLTLFSFSLLLAKIYNFGKYVRLTVCLCIRVFVCP